MSRVHIERHSTGILILGAGGAGLLAALHAGNTGPDLKITIAVKGLLGKCGCTRMVQGGYNVALADGDSIERHFMDTIEGGKWINNQTLAWRLVTGALDTIHELENVHGCFFDRNGDGSVHQKAFAGQTFDRTVHKGDLTGIEIINRLSEQVWARGVERMEDHRAIAFIPARDNSGLAGVLLIDMRDGSFHYVAAKAVLLATGGGPSMYRYHTPSGEKSCDGMAMALRAGLALRDMEMVQFHPTGLLAGPDTRMTGTVLEEGLRGAGGYLLDGNGERFMHRYDERGERATRDIVARSIDTEMRTGATGPNGGVYIAMAHLGPDNVRAKFKGMVDRCADCGFDLAAGRVEVVPTAHYMMGGVEFGVDCSTALKGLYAAGEDTGGVHGANRLGGNGVANSTVFGSIAGETMARDVAGRAHPADGDEAAIEAAARSALAPFAAPPGDLEVLRTTLQELMWNSAGISRHRARLQEAERGLADLAGQLRATGLRDANRSYNLTWHDWLNLDSQITVSQTIVAAALAREDSRGSHFREDFPETGDLAKTCYSRVVMRDAELNVTQVPVDFSLVAPGDSLIDDNTKGAP